MNLPFDLEKALAGEPVVTRSDKRVFNLAKTNNSLSGFDLVGMIGSRTHYWTIKGRYLKSDASPLDLFMLNTAPDDNNP